MTLIAFYQLIALLSAYCTYTIIPNIA